MAGRLVEAGRGAAPLTASWPSQQLRALVLTQPSPLAPQAPQTASAVSELALPQNPRRLIAPV